MEGRPDCVSAHHLNGNTTKIVLKKDGKIVVHTQTGVDCLGGGNGGAHPQVCLVLSIPVRLGFGAFWEFASSSLSLSLSLSL